MRATALSLFVACTACSTAAPRPTPDWPLAALREPQPMASTDLSADESDIQQGAAPQQQFRSDDAYISLMAGVFMPGGDMRDLDDGRRAEVVLGRDLVRAISVEVDLGYLDTEGTFRGSDFKTWALPAFVNWRFRLPIPIVRPYVGAGAGVLYADYEFVGQASTTEYLFAWDAFAGVEVEVGSLGFGAEYKFVQSEEADETAEVFNYEGQSLTAFLSVRF